MRNLNKFENLSWEFEIFPVSPADPVASRYPGISDFSRSCQDSQPDSSLVPQSGLNESNDIGKEHVRVIE
jgi:hypothetical protein